MKNQNKENDFEILKKIPYRTFVSTLQKYWQQKEYFNDSDGRILYPEPLILDVKEQTEPKYTPAYQVMLSHFEKIGSRLMEGELQVQTRTGEKIFAYKGNFSDNEFHKKGTLVKYNKEGKITTIVSGQFYKGKLDGECYASSPISKEAFVYKCAKGKALNKTGIPFSIKEHSSQKYDTKLPISFIEKEIKKAEGKRKLDILEKTPKQFFIKAIQKYLKENNKGAQYEFVKIKLENPECEVKFSGFIDEYFRLKKGNLEVYDCYNEHNFFSYSGGFKDGNFNNKGTLFTNYSGLKRKQVIFGKFVDGKLDGKVEVIIDYDNPAKRTSLAVLYEAGEPFMARKIPNSYLDEGRFKQEKEDYVVLNQEVAGTQKLKFIKVPKPSNKEFDPFTYDKYQSEYDKKLIDAKHRKYPEDKRYKFCLKKPCKNNVYEKYSKYIKQYKNKQQI